LYTNKGFFLNSVFVLSTLTFTALLRCVLLMARRNCELYKRTV